MQESQCSGHWHCLLLLVLGLAVGRKVEEAKGALGF